MVAFLEMRRGQSGEPGSRKLVAPEAMGNKWYRLPLQGCKRSELTELSTGGDGFGPAVWGVAWHGSRMGPIYPILFRGDLEASCDRPRGHPFLAWGPGVFVHKKGAARKANNYIDYNVMFGGGMLCVAKWTLRVVRSNHVKIAHPDQRAQPQESVVLCG